MTPSVVKSVLVTGITNSRGQLSVEIDRQNADLSVGRWLMAVDSLIVTSVSEPGPIDDVPISVSATHTYTQCRSQSGHAIQSPACQLLFILRQRDLGRRTLIGGNSNRFLEVQRPSNSFDLMFLHTETEAGVSHLRVQVLLLFTRVVQL
jgi:hypothetical protein